MLRFNSQKEMNQMYQQIKELAGWMDAEEKANRHLGFVKSKKEFVELQLLGFRRMGLEKIEYLNIKTRSDSNAYF
jgi:hypothetical protein